MGKWGKVSSWSGECRANEGTGGTNQGRTDNQHLGGKHTKAGREVI